MKITRYNDRPLMAKHLLESKAIKIYKLDGFQDYECFGCGKHGVRYEIYYLHPESPVSLEEWEAKHFDCDNMRLGPDCAKEIAKLAGIKLKQSA